MLVEAVALHEPALRASFWAVYGFPYESLDPLDAADLTSWLPAGCALWLSVGGPASIWQEVRELQEVNYRLKILAWMQTEDAQKGRNQPSPPEPIPYSDEIQARAEAEENHARRQYAARQRRDTARRG